jgi:hypothetical protein
MPKLGLNQAEKFAYRFYTEAGPPRDVSHEYSRKQLMAFLKGNIDDLCAEVEGMSTAQLAYRLPGKPSGPDESGDEENFDTSQVMTHMATSMAFHWWNITRAMRHERPPMPRPPEGAAVTGQKKRNAMGAGGWRGLSAEELCKLLRDTTNGFLSYVKELPDDTSEARSSFGIFRDMSPHDWLFVVAVHAGVHLIQVREIKGQPDFPKS